MATIKITRGGCGIKYTDANGVERHALKTPEHGAFECDDAQAARLVGARVAVYVTEKTAEVAPEGETGKLTGHLDPEQLETMDYNTLKKLASDMGVKPEGTKKADYIAAIAAAEVELDEADMVDDEEETDDMPDLNAADPE